MNQGGTIVPGTQLEVREKLVVERLRVDSEATVRVMEGAVDAGYLHIQPRGYVEAHNIVARGAVILEPSFRTNTTCEGAYGYTSTGYVYVEAGTYVAPPEGSASPPPSSTPSACGESQVDLNSNTPRHYDGANTGGHSPPNQCYVERRTCDSQPLWSGMPSAVTPSACSNGAAIAPYEFKASGDIDGYGYKQEAITTLQGCKDKCCQENQCQAIQFSATAVDGAERQCVLHNNAGDFNPSAGLYQDYHVHIRPAPLSASWMLPYAIDSCIVGPSGYGIFGRDSNGQGRPGGSMHLAETCDSPTHISQGSDTCIEANADAGSQDSCMPGTVCRRRKISDNGEDACGIEALHNDPQACNALGCCHHNDQNGRCWSSVGQGDCFSEKKCVPVNRALEVMGVFADRARLLRARDAYCSSPNAGAASHQPIGTWDVTNIPDLSNLFCASDCTNDRCQGCNPTCADFNEAIGRWDVSGATNMEVQSSSLRGEAHAHLFSLSRAPRSLACSLFASSPLHNSHMHNSHHTPY